MTIAEKNKDKLFEIAKDGDSVAVSKTGVIISCFSLSCNNCIGEAHKGLCMGTIKEYLNKEYIEPCPFEKGELVEVSDYGDLWCLRYFSYISSDASHKYRTVRKPGSNVTEGWEHCRKYGTLGNLTKEQANEQ